MIEERELVAGHISEGLEHVWRKSPVLEKVRRASLIQSREYMQNPFKFLIGGGDMDYSFICAKKLVGHDPYVEIYNQILLYLLSK